MKLIIGLGNVGKEFEQTRHNVGFLCLRKFASEHDLQFKTSKNYCYVRYRDSVLMMPSTFMNASGNAYKSALSKYSDVDDVLVIMDDIDIPTGEIRIRVSGGSGGHNGLKSILEAAGTTSINRIRIGIGRPDKGTPRSHVLNRFSIDERVVIDNTLTLLTSWLDFYIKNDMKTLLDEFSKWKKKPIPSAEDGINRPKEEPND